MILYGAISMAFYSPWESSIDFKQGRLDFTYNCAKCHSLEEGQQNYGPSLHAIGSLAADRVSGQTAAEYLWASVLEPDAHLAGEGQMPSGISATIGAERMRDLLCFLSKQTDGTWIGDLAVIPSRAKLLQPTDQKQKLKIQQIELGQALFHGRLQCGSCHRLNPVHDGDHLTAPDLAGIGLASRESLIDSIRRPSQTMVPRYQFASILLDDQVKKGRFFGDQGGDWQLLSPLANGWQLVSFSKSQNTVKLDAGELDLDESPLVRMDSLSSMPAYGPDVLSEEDLEMLLQFLRTLR
jgi:mono/diheme cytochrome c family protein